LERNRQVEVVFAGVGGQRRGQSHRRGRHLGGIAADMAADESLGVGAQVEIKAQIKADGVVEAKALAPRAQSAGSPVV
jgi:hypothetical protein